MLVSVFCLFMTSAL